MNLFAGLVGWAHRQALSSPVIADAAFTQGKPEEWADVVEDPALAAEDTAALERMHDLFQRVLLRRQVARAAQWYDEDDAEALGRHGP